MRVAVLFSGGKDSCLALHKANQRGYDIRYLLNVNPNTPDSFMFHKPDLKLLESQAEELGIELLIRKSKGEKENELGDLEDLIKQIKDKIDGIVVGGIASSYQGKRIDNICKRLNLEFIAPLWDYDGDKLWKELIEEGFKVVITKIACDGLDKKWIGKVIDKKVLEDLKKLSIKYRFRIDFEGGEAESAVLFMPEFKNELKLDFDVVSDGDYRHFMKIKKVLV
jgi:ABC transporter with metal-binding/Fe-S-binding domain ATP-binding protein